MKTEQTSPGHTGQGLPSRNVVKTTFWLALGAMVGIVGYNLIGQYQQAHRIKRVQNETVAIYNTLLPKAEQQLLAASSGEDELRNELAMTGVATTANDIKPAAYRPKVKRLKSQLEQAELSLKQLSDQNAKAMAIQPDSQFMSSEQKQKFEALVRQLDECWQELGSMENQLDWLAVRWSQLVAKEAEATKSAPVQTVPAPSDTQAATSLLLASALQRSQAETEHARAESLQRAALDTLQRVQPVTPTVTPAVFAPALYSPAPAYYYNDPAYYYGPYRGYAPPYRRLNGSYGYYDNAPYHRVHAHRFGSYLVID